MKNGMTTKVFIVIKKKKNNMEIITNHICWINIQFKNFNSIACHHQKCGMLNTKVIRMRNDLLTSDGCPFERW